MAAKTKWVDFNTVRKQVSFTQVLDRYGLTETMKQHGDALRGPCPIHKGENPTSFSVSVEKNAFLCFSCRAKGGVLDFVSAMESCSIREAALMLADWFELDTGKPPPKNRAGDKEAPPPATEPTPEEETLAPENKPLSFSLKGLDPTHPYLTERLTPAAIDLFGLGYYPGRGLMHGRVVIPIHNAVGELVAYAGRWPGDSGWPDGEGKYKLPPNFHKSLEVFNLHRARQAVRKPPLVVVEGIFDCISLWLADLWTVSTMGASVSDRQAALIAEAAGLAGVGHVALMFDADEAGREGSKNAVAKLAAQGYVKLVELGEGQQPEHLTPQETRRLFLGLL